METFGALQDALRGRRGLSMICGFIMLTIAGKNSSHLAFSSALLLFATICIFAYVITSIVQSMSVRRVVHSSLHVRVAVYVSALLRVSKTRASLRRVSGASHSLRS